MLKQLNQNSLEKAKPFLVVGLHVLSLILVFHFLSFQEFFKGLGSFKQWDAYWYEEIALNGYTFKPNECSSSGFFPLFSYIWGVTGFTVRGIGCLNFIFFITGLLLLKKAFSFSNSFLLLILSVPSMMFMYVPYTEALFFVATSLFIYGLVVNNNKAIYIGLFIASLTRPTAVFFIPSILFMELMQHKDVRTTVVNTLKYSAISVLGILVVLIIQYFQTGVWFAYFKAQSNSWKREIQIPELPFTTWDGTRMLWLDGIALFFGLLAFAIVLYVLIRKWIARKNIEINKASLFSFSYLAMAAFSIIFFNGKDALGGTSLMGGNRYILATPCFVVLLHYLSDQVSKDKILIILSVVTCTICVFMLGAGNIVRPFDHAHTNRYFLFVSLYVLSYLLLGTRYRTGYTFAMYTINIFAQMWILSYYSTGSWIG